MPPQADKKLADMRNSDSGAKRAVGNTAGAFDGRSDRKRIQEAQGAAKKAKAGIEALGAKAANAFGVPGGVGRIIVRLGIAGIILFFSLLFVILFLFSGGDQSETAGQNPKLAAKTGRPVIAEFKKAGRAYKIPWTVIGATAGAATEFGKYSPYDTFDRAPARTGYRRGAPGSGGGVTVGGAFGPCQSAPVGIEVKITSPFGEQRGGGPHPGIDLRAPSGTPILACRSGTVVWAGWQDGGFGNLVEIDPGNGQIEFYGHQSKILVSVGQVVTAGTQLGEAGSTGLSTGPHLHFEVRVDGKSVDPLSLASTAPVGDARGASVLVVGDSLCTANGGTALTEALQGLKWTPTLDCVTGRSLPGAGVEAVRAGLRSGLGGLVVALGTNDAVGGDGAAFAAAIDTVMSTAGGIPVVWVNVATDQPGADAINQAITTAAAKYPNVTVADAHAAIGADLRADELHLTDAGYRARAQLIATALSRSLGGGAGGVAAGVSNPPGLVVSAFPVVTPAIGGGDGQPGVGPFLIRRGAAKEAGIDAQSFKSSGNKSKPKTATDFVAAELAAARVALRKEGLRPTVATRDAFWAEAVRRVPLVDPRDGNCKLGDLIVAADPTERQALVAGEIRRVWACELGRADALYTLAGIERDGNRYSKRLLGAEARNTLLREALTVAWGYSQWGSTPCDPAAPLAGVFPLSAAVFDTYADTSAKARDRCDPAASIQAAARAFATGEGFPPGGGAGLVLPDGPARVMPVTEVSEITDSFDTFDPTSGGIQSDVGLTVPGGTTVLAIEAGTITFPPGAEVANEIDLAASTTQYRYIGMVGYAKGLVSGQRVAAGQVLGVAGPGRLVMSATVAGSPVRLAPTLRKLHGERVPDTRTDTAGTVGDRTTELGPYAPMVGGWWAMPWALGSDAARDRFLTEGPRTSWTPDGGCLDVVDQFVLAGSGSVPECGTDRRNVVPVVVRRANQLSYQVQSRAGVGAREAPPTARTPTTAPLGTVTTTAPAAPVAPAPTATTPTTARSTTPTPETASKDPLDRPFSLPTTLTPDQIAQYQAKVTWALDQVRSNGTELRPGIDVVVPRFNADVAALPVPSPPAAAVREDYAALITALAVDMGGLSVNDRRYVKAAEPLARLKAFGTAIGTTGRTGTLGSDIPYAEVFNAAGAEHGVDPRMLAAVAKKESSFSEATITCANASSAGALGLMQFMPATAAGIGINPCDPNEAIPAAARLLRAHYDRFGTWELAWAAYNAGAGNVERYGGVPPFDETQNYVRIVAQYWAEYKAQFPDGALSSTNAPSCLRTVAGITVACHIADNVDALIRAAGRDSLNLTGSGYRSYDEQVALRRAHCGTTDADIYQKSPGACSPPTAIPGTSNHETGEAIDFAACSTRATQCWSWLYANAGAYGLRNLESEPWHWSTTGT